ncbi:hypothetical protein BH23GEM9_BH23GEM9_03490 [soil metagenome]
MPAPVPPSTSRREFLATGATAVLAASVLPTTAIAADAAGG